MGNEQLTKWQASQLKWLKRQVDNLRDESVSKNPRPRIQQEIFAAMEELDDFVNGLKAAGIVVEHRRRSWHGVV